jgi:hypothetical protein
MAKSRSPDYPAIGLREAIERARRVYESGVYQSPVSKEVFAQQMGYKGLSGASLPVLSALSKYGLIEGRGNDTRVSSLAVSIIAHEPGAAERANAIREAASKPELFAELDSRYVGGVGRTPDQVIRGYLLTRGFIPPAADAAIRSYRETKALAEAEPVAHNSIGATPVTAAADPTNIEVGDLVQVEVDGVLQFAAPVRVRAVQEYEGRPWVFVEGSDAGVLMENVTLEHKEHKGPSDSKPPLVPPRLPEDKQAPAEQSGFRREVFALDEGDVVLTFPENLSAASFFDLDDHLRIFIRKAQRRAAAGDFFAEIYAPDGLRAREVRYFERFDQLASFANEFKTKKSNDILRIHLPARATDEQKRQAVLDWGAQSA